MEAAVTMTTIIPREGKQCTKEETYVRWVSEEDLREGSPRRNLVRTMDRTVYSARAAISR